MTSPPQQAAWYLVSPDDVGVVTNAPAGLKLSAVLGGEAADDGVQTASLFVPEGGIQPLFRTIGSGDAATAQSTYQAAKAAYDGDPSEENAAALATATALLGKIYLS